MHGHYGRPIVVLPPTGGRAWDFDDNGLIDAVSDLAEGGRAKIYCVDGRDNDDVQSRAAYEAWVLERVLPFVYEDCGGPLEMVVAGCADGAVSAADLALGRADLFPAAVCMSGRFDDEVTDAVARLGPDQVDWINGRVNLVLGVSSDADAAAATAFAARLRDLGIRYAIDQTPADTPCGWPAWRHLAASTFPRFC